MREPPIPYFGPTVLHGPVGPIDAFGNTSLLEDGVHVDHSFSPSHLARQVLRGLPQALGVTPRPRRSHSRQRRPGGGWSLLPHRMRLDGRAREGLHSRHARALCRRLGATDWPASALPATLRSHHLAAGLALTPGCRPQGGQTSTSVDGWPGRHSLRSIRSFENGIFADGKTPVLRLQPRLGHPFQARCWSCLARGSFASHPMAALRRYGADDQSGAHVSGIT